MYNPCVLVIRGDAAWSRPFFTVNTENGLALSLGVRTAIDLIRSCLTVFPKGSGNIFLCRDSVCLRCVNASFILFNVIDKIF